MQFPKSATRGKWKVVKVVHCPTLWMDKGSRLYLPDEKVITKRRIILDMQFPNQPLGVKWKVVKVVHCPHSMDGKCSHCLYLPAEKMLLQKKDIVLDMQFPNQPLGVQWKVVKVVHCPTLWMDTGFMSLSC